MSDVVRVEIIIPAEELSSALVGAIFSRRQHADSPLQEAVALAVREGHLTARIREGIKLALEDPALPRLVADAYKEGLVEAVKTRAAGQVRNAKAIDFQRAIDALRVSEHQFALGDPECSASGARGEREGADG